GSWQAEFKRVMPLWDVFFNECMEACALEDASASPVTITQIKQAFRRWCKAQDITPKHGPWSDFYGDGSYAELLLLQRYCQQRKEGEVFVPQLRFQHGAEPSATPASGQQTASGPAALATHPSTSRKRKNNDQGAPASLVQAHDSSNADGAEPAAATESSKRPYV
ncbi:MAG: hypothetical protein P4L81_06375, partial [Candidatus Pacebacteria bacterium]|nr:hypothetical protein [Candidatus Paceibacterota bacterium]